MRLHRCDHCGTRRPRSIRAAEMHELAHHYDQLRGRLRAGRLAPVLPLRPIAA